MADRDAEIRKELIFHLNGGNAHVKFEEAVDGFPAKLTGAIPQGLPYSAWQLLEHLRIAQEDIVQFCDNANGRYVPPEWPEYYWSKSPAPPTPSAWSDSVRRVLEDRNRFISLLNKGDLFAPFPWGDGQTLLREAMVVIDHNSYHIGQIVAVRRLLNAWS
jgi:hypothetical protein